MKRNNRLNNRSIIAAALTVSFLMLVFGVTHRILGAWLESDSGISSIPPDALEKLPLQINQWMGQDEPLNEAVIEATDTDAHINRRYCRYTAAEQVLLFVTAGTRARDLMPHRPEVCYTGAGWTRVNNKTVEFPLDDGTTLPCSVFQFTKGALNAQKIVILDYYIVDGQFCRDISLLRSKIWRGSGAVNYVVQVQILGSVPADQTVDSTEEMVFEFACESAPFISHILDDIANYEASDTKIDNMEDSE